MLWSQVPPEEVEQIVARILKKSGFSDVKVVGGPNNAGVDIVCYRDDPIIGYEKVIVQVKRHSSKVGLNEIQNFHMVVNREKSARAIYVCTGGFTKNAIDYVRIHAPAITLWDGLKLDALVERYGIRVNMSNSDENGVNLRFLNSKTLGSSDVDEVNYRRTHPSVKTCCLGRYIYGDVEEYVRRAKEEYGIDEDPVEVYVHLAESYLVEFKYYYVGYDSAGRRRRRVGVDRVLITNNGILDGQENKLMKCFDATDYSIGDRITLPVVERVMNAKYEDYKILQKEKIYVIVYVKVFFTVGLGELVITVYPAGMDESVNPPDSEVLKNYLEKKYNMKVALLKKKYAELTNGHVLLRVRLDDFGRVREMKRIFLNNYFEKKIGGKIITERDRLILVKKGNTYSRYMIDRNNGKYEHVDNLIPLEEAESRIRKKYDGMVFDVVKEKITIDGWKICVEDDVEGCAVIGNIDEYYDTRVTEEYVKNMLSSHGRVESIVLRSKSYVVRVENDEWKYVFRVNAESGKVVSKKQLLKSEAARKIAARSVHSIDKTAKVNFTKKKWKNRDHYVLRFYGSTCEGVVYVNIHDASHNIVEKVYSVNYVKEYFKEKYGEALKRLSIRKKSARILIRNNDEYVYMKYSRFELNKMTEDRVPVKGIVARLKKKAMDIKYFG